MCLPGGAMSVQPPFGVQPLQFQTLRVASVVPSGSMTARSCASTLQPSCGYPVPVGANTASDATVSPLPSSQRSLRAEGQLPPRFPARLVSSPLPVAPRSVQNCMMASTTPRSPHELARFDKEFSFAPVQSGGVAIEQLVIKATSRVRCPSPTMRSSGIVSTMVAPFIPEVVSPITWASGSLLTVTPTEDATGRVPPREVDEAEAGELEKPATRRRISILATPRRRQAKAPAARNIRTPDDISGTFLAASVDTFFASGLRNASIDPNTKPKKLIQAPPASGLDDVKFGGKLPGKERRLTIPSSNEEVNDLAYIYQQVGPTGVTPQERGARTLGGVHV